MKAAGHTGAVVRKRAAGRKEAAGHRRVAGHKGAAGRRTSAVEEAAAGCIGPGRHIGRHSDPVEDSLDLKRRNGRVSSRYQEDQVWVVMVTGT